VISRKIRYFWRNVDAGFAFSSEYEENIENFIQIAKDSGTKYVYSYME